MSLSPEDAAKVYNEATVIDLTCPLLREAKYLDWCREGRLTAVAPTVTAMTGNASTGFGMVGGWLKYQAERADDTLIVRQTADIERAKAEGKLGLIMHSQGTAIIEDNLDLLDAYQAAGLRIVQLCYNRKNLVGDGASERTDAGLSDFGVALVKRLNRLRMAVDCAHTGIRTSFDAIEISEGPVIISHANARKVCDNRRNVPDDLIRAIAATGGVVGTVGFPAFLKPEGQPTLDQLIDDIAYKADLVGIDHVGLGIDYYLGQHPVEDLERATARYNALVAAGQWGPGEYPPPPYIYPEGIETPRTLYNLGPALARRGFTAEDMRKVLGGNWLRVLREVWGG
ncbi:MAG TPA: membrane dipeptidase [Alphaproteobacteria bacterium]|nr:membrane dipeptidase [Alphaproteobacteria bacterium]